MYVTYDYRCILCKHKQTKFVKKEDCDKQLCEKCRGGLLRLPPGPKTTFKFNDKN